MIDIGGIYRDLPILETKRLILRRFTYDDVNDLYEYASDSETTKYLTWDTYFNRQQAFDYITLIVNRYMNGEHAPWAVVLKENKKMIGSIDLVTINMDYRSAELGYVFNRNYWGKGYGTEAAHKLLDFAFNVLKLHRVFARCNALNTGSERIMQKLGMRYEGTFFQSEYRKNHYQDIKYYAILENEYRNRN